VNGVRLMRSGRVSPVPTATMRITESSLPAEDRPQATCRPSGDTLHQSSET
jgi:hypothetical protein